MPPLAMEATTRTSLYPQFLIGEHKNPGAQAHLGRDPGLNDPAFFGLASAFLIRRAD